MTDYITTIDFCFGVDLHREPPSSLDESEKFSPLEKGVVSELLLPLFSFFYCVKNSATCLWIQDIDYSTGWGDNDYKMHLMRYIWAIS